MKKILFLLFSIITPLISAQNLSEYPNFKKYEKENDIIIRNKQYPKVIFIGNSITEGWVKTHPKFFKDNNYLGRGIGGQTSPQLLLRFQKDVIELKPKAVVINIGTNDIAENTGKYSIEYTMSNIKSMVEIAKANKIKVYLSSVLPVKKYPWKKDIANVVELIHELNMRILQLAKMKHVEYIDYFTPMCKSDGGLIDDYTYDGVHPTAKGYSIMEKIVQRKIK